jgi:imidazolonepropionase-like amidohydrolase
VKDGEHPYHLVWRELVTARRQKGGNAFNLREVAGAFGDLGTLNGIACAMRTAVESGLLLGPRVIASGAGITTTGGHV